MVSLGAEDTPRRGVSSWLVGLFDPMVVKELRATFRSSRTSYAMWGILLLMALVLVAAMVSMSEATAGGRGFNPTRVGSALFGVFLGVHLLAIFTILPAFACTTLTEERTRQSFDLLVTTCLSASRIVAGKVLACFLVGGITTASTLPLMTVVVFFGGVAPEVILASYVGLLACAFMVTLLGVWASALTATTTRAIILTYLALGPYTVLVISGVWLPLVILGLAPALEPLPPPLDAGLAPGNRALLVLVSVLLLAFVGRFLFLLAVNRVEHPAANRSTPLRVLFVVVVATLLVGVVSAEHVNEAALVGGVGGVTRDTRNLLSVVVGLVLSGLLLVGTVTFCTEETRPSKRLRAAMVAARGRGVIQAMFLPGSHHGVRLMSWVMCLSLPIMAIILWRGLHLAGDPLSGWRPGDYALRWWVAWTLAFLLFIGQISSWIARRTTPLRARYWTTLLVLALMLWPVFPYLVISRSRPSGVHHCYYLSAPLVLRSIYVPPTEARRSLQLGGNSSQEIRARLWDLRHMPGQPAGEPGDKDSGPGGPQQQARPSALVQERQRLVSQGVAVHVASTWVFAILGGIVGLWNLTRGDQRRGQ